MNRRYTVTLLTCLLVLSTLTPDTEAIFRRTWRRIKRTATGVYDAITNPEDYYNQLKDKFESIDWSDPSTYTSMFQLEGCENVCPACVAIPEAGAQTICMTYCVATCAWEYASKRDVDEQK